MIFLNDQQAQIEIWKLLMEYANMLEVDSGLIEDLLELLSSSGVEKRFLKRLEKYLQQLREDGEKAIGKKGDPMEHLGGSSSLCSMRFPLGVSNIRILFAYRNNKVYLLCSFYERQGHKNTEYDAHIPVAQKRLAEILGEK